MNGIGEIDHMIKTNILNVCKFCIYVIFLRSYHYVQPKRGTSSQYIELLLHTIRNTTTTKDIQVYEHAGLA